MQNAIVDWSIETVDGTQVVSFLEDRELSPGSLSWKWDGRDAAGSFVADGRYRSVITAETSAGTVRHSGDVMLSAFKITASRSPLERGRGITFTIRSTEPLDERPRLRITQPGLDPYVVTTSRTGESRYEVQVRLRSGGGPGEALVRAYGVDIDGQPQWTLASFPLE
jgi:hypothetical protein